MLKALIVIFIIMGLSWVVTYFHEKYKKIAIFFTFLGVVGILLGAIEFFTDYNPLESIKSIVVSKFQDSSEPTTVIGEESSVTKEEAQTKTISPIQVKIPQEANNSSHESEISESENNYSDYTNTPIILNVEKKMYRDETGIIHISWTPIFNHKKYKLKVEVDDPFSNIENNQEFTCKNNWYDLNLSQCSSDTVIFVSVGIFDKNISEWVYSEKTSFVLY